MKKWSPVDEFGQLGQVEVFKNTAANKLGHGRRVICPINARGIGARLGKRPHRCLLFVGVLNAYLGVVAVELVNVFGRIVRQQALRHANATGRIGHIHHRTFIMRRDFDGCVHPAGGGAANHQGDFFEAEVIVFLHFGRNILHLFKAGRDQP